MGALCLRLYEPARSSCKTSRNLYKLSNCSEIGVKLLAAIHDFPMWLLICVGKLQSDFHSLPSEFLSTSLRHRWKPRHDLHDDFSYFSPTKTDNALNRIRSKKRFCLHFRNDGRLVAIRRIRSNYMLIGKSCRDFLAGGNANRIR